MSPSVPAVRVRSAVAALAVLVGLHAGHAGAQGGRPPAASGAPIEHLRIDRVEVTMKIAADATTRRTHRLETTALTREGAGQAGRRQIQFNRDMETVEIVEAVTVKADGTRIPVRPEGISTQVGLTVGGGPGQPPAITMASIETRQFTFPDLGPGDRSVLAWTVHRHRAELPGFVRFEALLAPGVTYGEARYRIEAPESFSLAVDVEGLGWTHRRENGTDVWEAEGASARGAIEPGAVDAWLHMPRILASSFADDAALAVAYGRAVDAAARPTDAVRALARRIVGDRSADAAKAAAIHDWVRTNLRYAAIWVGVDGWVPHDVETVLAIRYGDCKDLSTLMIALLRAVDVEAVPALISTAPVYTRLPVGLGPNHVIVHLPSLGLFADPTATDVPFGALPFADLDKPVAVALADGTRRLRTPADVASGDHANTLAVRSSWTIARDGNASATIDVTAGGTAASTLRTLMLSSTGSDAAARILSSSRLEGRGRIDWPTRDALDGTQRVRLEFPEIRGLVPEQQTVSVAPHPMVALPIYALRHLGDLSLAQRRTSIACAPGRVVETFDVSFDDAWRPRRIPDPVRIVHEDGIVFEARYAMEGNRLVGRRELTLEHGRHVCTPEQYAARRDTLQRIARHLRGTVIVEQP